jgi:hypothetical protein
MDCASPFEIRVRGGTVRGGKKASVRLTVWCALLVALLGATSLAVAFRGPPAPPQSPTPVTETGSVAETGESPGRRPSPSAAAGERRPGAGGHAGVEDLISGPVLPAAQPVSVSIPRLRVTSRLVSLGQEDSGVMEVPADPATAGWYRLGPTPGALGPAVLAGHVTWNQVPAVFFELASLRPGDAIEVSRDDDTVAVFEVTRVVTYAKSEFPTRTVFGGIDYAGLRLITCGGEFDASSRRYRDNVVAFAELVSARPSGEGEAP